MESIGRLYCLRCAAQLRRGRPAGLCDPCLRKVMDVRQVLAASFYADPGVVAMMGAYDFGRFFRTVRCYTGWTQETLAEVVALTQADVSKIECDRWRLRDLTTIRRVAERLFIPAVLLGVGITVGPRDSGSDEWKEVVRVDRRRFGQHVATTALGLAGAGGPAGRAVARG